MSTFSPNSKNPFFGEIQDCRNCVTAHGSIHRGDFGCFKLEIGS